MHRIDGPGATVDNKFTEGDPVGGVQATVVTNAWLNDVQEEIISVLSMAGVTPVKGTQDQLALAISKIIQGQIGSTITTAGTSSAFTLTPSPAIAGYVAQRFNVAFHVAGAATPTINVSARGAKNLKQYDASGAKVAAIIGLGQISDIVYDGTDFVVLDPLPSVSNDAGLAGVASRLRITTDGTTGQAVVSAASVFLSDSTGRGAYIAINSTASIATSGLGGLDTGSPAANTFYYLWAVRISGAQSLVFSLSSTAPAVATVPAGAMTARLGTVRTGAVATVLRPGLQRGKKYQYDPRPSTNFTALTSVASASSSISATAVTISGEAPPTAVAVEVCIGASASGASMAAIVTPRAASGTLGVSIAIPSGATSGSKGSLVLAESVIYWATAFTGSGTANIYIAGWEEE